MKGLFRVKSSQMRELRRRRRDSLRLESRESQSSRVYNVGWRPHLSICFCRFNWMELLKFPINAYCDNNLKLDEGKEGRIRQTAREVFKLILQPLTHPPPSLFAIIWVQFSYSSDWVLIALIACKLFLFFSDTSQKHPWRMAGPEPDPPGGQPLTQHWENTGGPGLQVGWTITWSETYHYSSWSLF